jgi:hypothetical protein
VNDNEEDDDDDTEYSEDLEGAIERGEMLADILESVG